MTITKTTIEEHGRKIAEEYVRNVYISEYDNGPETPIQQVFQAGHAHLASALLLAVEALECADVRLAELGCPENGFEREPLLDAITKIEKLLGVSSDG